MSLEGVGWIFVDNVFPGDSDPVREDPHIERVAAEHGEVFLGIAYTEKDFELRKGSELYYKD